MMLKSTATVMPANFVPASQHIIIGRGRIIKQHPGNVKFDKMISEIAGEYSSTPSKAEKGLILTKLINDIHEAAPDAGFVRKDLTTGEWTLVEEALARQTAAQALRNYLHTSYRSSKQFKSKRRMQRISQVQQELNSQKSLSQSLMMGSGIPSMITIHATPEPFTRCVSPTDSDNGDVSKDTLDILLSQFMPANIAGNPFEPLPLAPSIAMEEDFEPIPL
ncbi:Nitrilase family, member 2 [Seminavis robusta]|uniref:Nitrilase family, member 2 n=1 Tax=Seminavis robusta TaxID=568900 RepID=A0A9N8HWZ2_9STRA|nr:Nitrilase family, member 2 [Seminavis robusta]|eukprot:Sro2086_g313860.1 Nitrilase family, member 2 (220) ;mRNA; f:9606-10265